MNCPRCHQEVEDGALFCGNCGLALQVTNQANTENLNQIPAYALATPETHSGEKRSLIALLLAVGGLVGSLFMAVIGLALGLSALILATVSRSYHHRLLNTSAIVSGCMTILLSLAVWGVAIAQNAKEHSVSGQPATTVYTASLSTPCYSLSFVNKLNVSNNSNSCNAVLYNGASFANSTDAYKIYANQSNIINSGEFFNLAKKAIDQDLSSNLASFQVDSEGNGSFAGSPAYMAHVYNQVQNVAVAEAAVYHSSSSGPNIFILVHAINGRSTDFKALGAQWQWE